VDEDAVILTSYFRERRRAGGSRGEALIDLYGLRSVAASVLLRGIEGHGSGQPADVGGTLPSAEDPPLTAVVVDTAPRIDAVLGEVTGIAQPGLTTWERARLLSGEIDPVWLGESSSEATRLTIYCGHADRVFQVPAFEAACELLYRREIAGATVLSGIDGTVGGRRQRAHSFRRDGDAPVMVVTVGSGERIATILPELGGLFRHPLMTIAKVRLFKRDGKIISSPETLPDGDDPATSARMAPQVKLTVYTSEAARINGRPTHREIVRLLRAAGVGGVTSHRGTWGFHGEHPPHGDHFPRHGRHVPVVTTVIERADRIGTALDVIDALTPDRGLVTAETVLTPQSAEAPSDRGA
jgi:PII-like signaling protein